MSIAAGATAFGLVLLAPMSASAGAYLRTYASSVQTTEWASKYSSGYRQMDGGRGWVEAGGGGSTITLATFEERNLDSSSTLIGGTTASGWTVGTFYHLDHNAVQSSCYWHSDFNQPSDKLGLVCKYTTDLASREVAELEPGRFGAPSEEPNLRALTSGPVVTLPESELEVLPIDYSTVHVLGGLEGVSYYVAQGTNGDVCLVTVFNDGSLAGTHCAAVAVFNERGLAGGLANSRQQTQAYLVPDVAATARDASGLTPLSANLFVAPKFGTPHSVAGGNPSIAFADGTSFLFPSVAAQEPPTK